MRYLKSYKIFEAFKSSRLSKLKKQLDSDRNFESYFNYITKISDIKISELTDNSILFVSPYEVESHLSKLTVNRDEDISYDDTQRIELENTKYVFWFTDDNGCLLLTKNYIELEGNIYNGVIKRNGITGYDNQLNFYDYCIVIDFNEESKNKSDLIEYRTTSRYNAQSLKSDKDIKKENLERYREILVSRYNFTEDMSELSTNMKKLLDVYFSRYNAYRLLYDSNGLKNLVSSLDDLYGDISSKRLSNTVREEIIELYKGGILSSKYTKDEMINIIEKYNNYITGDVESVTKSLFILTDLYDRIDEKIKSIVYKSEIRNHNNIYRLYKTLELISDISNRYTLDRDYLEGYNQQKEDDIRYLLSDIDRIKRQIKLSEDVIELLDSI